MSDEKFLKEDLIQLRKDLDLTQQEMAERLDMALRAYQAIEAGESDYRYIHRLAAERVALAVAVDKKAPNLAPFPVREDAIELVREGQVRGDPAYTWDRPSLISGPKDTHDAKFHSAYAVVGEFVLISNAIDYQLNHVLIQVLHLTDSPLLESVIATLNTAQKLEILKKRSRHIAQRNWREPVSAYVEKLERISEWRNIACRNVLVPDETHGSAFAPTTAADLLNILQNARGPSANRIPIAELNSAIALGESALGAGENIIENFKKFNAERTKRAAAEVKQKKGATITVYKVAISKEQFRSIPSEERAIIFVAGHVLNQISVFMKLVRFSTNNDPVDPIEGRVSAAQSQLMLRCLIGVLAEAWEFIRRPINQRIIGGYLDAMDDDGKISYDRLKKQFGKGLLYKLRNKFLYHYPTAVELDKAFASIPSDEDWEWYLSEANTNSFYFSCELALGYGIMSATGEPLHIGAFGTIMQEVMQGANTMPYFLMPLIKAILTKHLGEAILDPQPGTIIRDAPQLGGFWIPFFAVTQPQQSSRIEND